MIPTTDLYKSTLHLTDNGYNQVYAASIFSFANDTLATKICIGVSP